MNQKGKEWIKKNWYRPMLHFIPVVFLFYALFSVLDVWINSISNDTSLSWDLFVTISCFGTLILLVLIFLYLDKWSDRFDVYRREYQEYIKEES